MGYCKYFATQLSKKSRTWNSLQIINIRWHNNDSRIHLCRQLQKGSNITITQHSHIRYSQIGLRGSTHIFRRSKDNGRASECTKNQVVTTGFYLGPVSKMTLSQQQRLSLPSKTIRRKINSDTSFITSFKDSGSMDNPWRTLPRADKTSSPNSHNMGQSCQVIPHREKWRIVLLPYHGEKSIKYPWSPRQWPPVNTTILNTWQYAVPYNPQDSHTTQKKT